MGSNCAENGGGEQGERLLGQREVPEGDRVVQAEAQGLRGGRVQVGHIVERDRRHARQDQRGQQRGRLAHRQARVQSRSQRRQTQHVPQSGESSVPSIPIVASRQNKQKQKKNN